MHIKLTESTDARNARLNATEQKRRDTAQAELEKIKPRLLATEIRLEQFVGDGKCVIYTGGDDCPVFVTLNDCHNGVLPNIGLERATRLDAQVARRLAASIRNGNNEVARVCTERRALEMEVALMKSVESLFERVANGLPL